jgi:hypothetical protein
LPVRGNERVRRSPTGPVSHAGPFLYPGAVNAPIRNWLNRVQFGRAIPEQILTAREEEVLKLVAEGHSSRRSPIRCSSASKRSSGTGRTCSGSLYSATAWSSPATQSGRARIHPACETASLEWCGPGGVRYRGSASRGDEEVSITDMDPVARPGAPPDPHAAGSQAYSRELEEQRRLPATSPLRDIVDVWGEDSFPASDPPSNW